MIKKLNTSLFLMFIIDNIFLKKLNYLKTNPRKKN